MSTERELRWTIDCWRPGCGWSHVGWDTAELLKEYDAHVAEKHPPER